MISGASTDEYMLVFILRLGIPKNKFDYIYDFLFVKICRKYIIENNMQVQLKC